MRMPSKILLNILFFKTVKAFQCQWIGLTLLAWSQSNLSNVSNTSSGLLTLNTSLAPKLRAWMDKLLESHCCVHNGLYKQVYMKIPPHEETVWAKHYFPKSFPRGCTYMHHFFLKQILLPGPENQKFRKSSEHLLQSNVSAIVFPRFGSLQIQNENIFACVQAAMQKKKIQICRPLLQTFNISSWWNKATWVKWIKHDF